MTEINSPQNSHFRKWKSLLDARGINKEGLFLLSGRKIVGEVLENQSANVVAILSFQKADQPTHLLHRTLFNQLDVLGTRFPLLVMKAQEVQPWDQRSEPREFELLVGLSDPGNLGAVLRSCVAFGVTNVVLLNECANPLLPKAIKTSSGAILAIRFSRGPSIQALTLSKGICLDMEGQALSAFEWPTAGRLLLGEEGQGIPSHLSGLTRVRIPISSATESLNAVVAASIALYDRKVKLDT